MSFLFKENDYHDAVVRSMNVDYATSSITLIVDAYCAEKPSERTEVLIIFTKVYRFSAINNISDILEHAKFGNVNYITEYGEGKVYIYLSNGLLEVVADAISIRANVR